jgi:hypothetical protein
VETTQSAKVRMRRSKVRGLLVELSSWASSIMLSRKGLEVTCHFHRYAVTTLPSVEVRFGCEQGAMMNILSKV